MLSVVIPCQEDHVLLFPTVKSIFLNKFCSEDFEVILICNNSFLVSENVNRFPIQVHPGTFKNQAQALNWNLERTRGDIICTTKPGCVVASNWLSEIARFLQYNPKVDGVGGPVLPCLDYGTKIQKLASQIFNEEQAFPDSATILKQGEYRGLLHATNSAFRKDVLNQMKFDESFSYNYDFDICWRMLRKGYRLAYNPKMMVRYIFPLSMYSLLNRYYYWGKEGVALRKKHFPGMDFMSFIYPPYNMARSLLEPSSLISAKKLLRFVQHLAFNLGCMRGYEVH